MLYIIPGKPVPWKRAGRNRAKTYDAQKAEKTRFRQWMLTQAPKPEIFTDALCLTIEFQMPKHSRVPSKRAGSAVKPPFSGIPDLDNLIKFVCDALNGFLWMDDALVAQVHARKVHSTEPQTLFHVVPYGPISGCPFHHFASRE